MLITRCPNCETTFRVRMEQLNLRGGRVRCGHCHVPFSALASLEELPEETATTQLGATPPPAIQPPAPIPTPAPAFTPPAVAPADDLIAPINLPPTPPALHRQEPHEEQASSVATQIVPLDGAGDLDFDIEDIDDSSGDARPATSTGQGDEPRSEPFADEPLEETDKQFIELGSAADDDAEAFDREFEKNLGPDDEDDEDAGDTLIPGADFDDGDNVPQLHTIFLDEDMPPGTGIDSAAASARRNARGTLLLGNVLLLLTGLLLSTYVLRVELTRLYPGLRAPLEQACQIFACEVPYPRDADEVLLVGSDLTQAGNPVGGYHLAVTVRNHAHYPVAWPQLEITLTDRFERALTRRVLEPREWLPANLAERPAFEAQGELTSQITLSSDSQVMGYRLGVFYR